MSSGVHYLDKIRSSIQTSKWQTNWSSMSEWFRTTLSEEGKREEKFSNYTANDRVNTDLPKLPLPDLQHTLTRYLEALQPILPEKQFERTKRIVEEFGGQGGDGERIQQGLRKRREDFHNWAYDWWLDDMYLNNPISLPINSNPGMVFPPRKFTSSTDTAKFAARLISSAFLFKQRIDRSDLPLETVVTNGVSQPLCMAQYDRIFTTYRAPGVIKDVQHRIGVDYGIPDPHVIVVCREQFYQVRLLNENRELLSENEIATRLAYILNDRKKHSTHYPIGLLTGMKRDWWATIREQLLEDSENQTNMLAIETCMLIVCFDMETLSPTFNSNSKYSAGGFKTPARDETNMMHQMIHGGGSVANSGNRWFDKTIQLIVSQDGVNGLCYEHSPAEGVAVINAMESMLSACDNLNDITIEPDLKGEAELKPLVWNVTPDLDREICFAREIVDKNVQDLDFKVFRFEEYGKNFIKSCRCSPDAFVQLALQLAYYRLHGTLCATYESASTRRFRLGRVDCIRAETMEVLRWVTCMEPTANDTSVQVPLERKLELFDEALQKQTLITTENITGYGIDVHLLGLRQMAKDYKMYAEIFEDETYALANQFLLSTSQVATKIDGFMGYGPVVPNGYGASYNPKDNSIIFCISSFQSSPITSTAEFTQTLNESLKAMKALVVNRK